MVWGTAAAAGLGPWRGGWRCDHAVRRAPFASQDPSEPVERELDGRVA